MEFTNYAKCGIRLRPFRSEDFPKVFAWRTSMPEVYIWNGERNYIDAENFRSELEEFQKRCDDIAIIEKVTSDKPELVGFVYAEGIRPTRTSASVGMYVAPEHRGSFAGPVSFALFSWHLFFAHSRAKVNLAIADWNKRMLHMATKSEYLEAEGVQRGELVLNGGAHDYHLFAFTRSSFEAARRSRFWERFIGPVDG